MQDSPESIVEYRRARFTARLPTDRLYTPWHFWVQEIEPGLWRVGFTNFAIRMLGDLVEHGYKVKEGDSIVIGQTIGWIEGFKAVTDLYSIVEGVFAGGNPAIDKDITLIDSDPYGQGWLYVIRGTPDSSAVDARRYTQVLDAAIDRMRQKMQQEPKCDE